MFMLTFRVSRVKILAGVLVLVLAGVLGVTGMRLADTRKTVTAQGPEAVATLGSRKTTVRTNAQRLEFIRSFGWEPGEEAVEVVEVIIPKEFDQVYQQYNSMQKQQGFDLEKFAGKRVKRYSYVINNYPGDLQNIRFNLLVRDNKVIGGDVCQMEQGGFLHGFAKQ